MKIIDCVQGTPEWYEARRGYPTASCFDQIMQPKKRIASASQEKYIASLIADITCPSANYFTSQGGPVNASVEYGRKTEDEARRWYEAQYDCQVQQVGFCIDDTGRIGCSPDGLVGEEGGIELKCRDRNNAILALMKNEIPIGHLCQCHGFLIVTGRKWIDYISYCVGAPALVKRVFPDDFTLALRVQVEMFLAKYEKIKQGFNIKKEDENVETPESRAEVAKWNDRLATTEGDVHDGTIDEEAAVERVNGWLPELKGYEHGTKRAVYQILKRWLDLRPVKWHLDSVALIYRLQESVRF